MSFQDEVRAAFRRGDSDGVLELAGAEVRRARAAGDAGGEVEALYAMARLALRGGDLGRGEELALAALEVATRGGDRRLEERPRHVLAAVARMSGDHAVARERYLASIALNEELGKPATVNSERHNLGFVELHLGDVDRARELFAQVRAQAEPGFLPYVGLAAAALASAEGDHVGAARMVGFTDGAFAGLGQVPDPDDAAELERVRAAVVAALGGDEFAAAYAVGKRWDSAEAFG